MNFIYSLNSRTRNSNAYSILVVLVAFVLFSIRAEGLGSDATLAIPKHGPVFVARLGIHDINATLKTSVADSQKSRDSLYGGLGFLAVMDRDRTGPEGKPQVAFLFSQLPAFVRPCPMSGKARYHASIVQWAPGMSKPRQVLQLSRGSCDIIDEDAWIGVAYVHTCRFEEHETVHKPVHQTENPSESTASYSFAGVVSMESSALLHHLISHPGHFFLRLAPCGQRARVLRGELHSNVAAFMGLPKTVDLTKSSALLSPPYLLPTHSDPTHPLSSHEVKWQAYRAYGWILTSLNLSSFSNVKDRDPSGSFSSHVSREDVFSLHSAQEKSSADPGDEGLKAAKAQLSVNDGMQQSENGIIAGVDPEADAFAKQANQDTSATADPMVGGGNPSATSANQILSSMGSATNSQRDGVPDYGANFQSSAIDSTFGDSRGRAASNSHENELSNPLSGAGRIARTSIRTGETSRPGSILGADGSGNTGYTANPSLGSDSNALSYGLGSVLTVVNEILGRDAGSYSGRAPPSSDQSGDQVYVRTPGLRRSGVRGPVAEGAYDPYAKSASTSSSVPATSSNLPASSATLPTSNSSPLPKPEPSLDNDSDTPKIAPGGRNPNLGTPLDPAAGSAVPASSFRSNPIPAADIPAGFPGATTGPQPNTGPGAAQSRGGVPPLPGPQIGFDTAAPAADRPDESDQTNLIRGLLGYFQTPSEFVPPPPPPPPPVIPRSTSATAGLGGDQFLNGGFFNGVLPSGTGRMSMSAQDSNKKVTGTVDDVHPTVAKASSPPILESLPPIASPATLVVDASRVVSVVVQALAYAANNLGL